MDPDRIAELYAYPPTPRAWLRTNFVSTVDGAAWDASGRSGSLGGEVDTAVFGVLRSLCDVILVGAGTARAEGYRLPSPDQMDAGLRARLGLAPAPRLAVVSRSLAIPERLAGALIVTAEARLSDRPAWLGDDELILAGPEQVDLHAALGVLAERGMRRILCEGGPTLHGDLLAVDLVDELCWTVDPRLMAGPAARIAHGATPVDRRFALGHVERAGDVLLTRYVRAR